MGLSKDVRDFFTGRINRLLDERLQAIYDKIDRKAIRAQAVTRLLKDTGVTAKSLARVLEIEIERDKLYSEQSKIKDSICAAIQKEYPRNNVYRNASNFQNEIENFAATKYEGKVLSEVHPELVSQIEEIRKIKEDVEGVVLLATTETKLVARLTAVLEKYGGGIPELLKFIPE